MKHDHPQFKLRLPPDLKNALEEQAARNDRTLTGEIVARLQASFAKDKARMQSDYAVVLGDDQPPQNIFAELAIHAERRALSAEFDRLHMLQDELWTVNSWREAFYGQNCAHQLNELMEALVVTPLEIAELEKEIESARADADAAAQKAPELPGPWRRR